jgi:hypothetical protein
MRFPFLLTAAVAASLVPTTKALSTDASKCAHQIGREIYDSPGSQYHKCMQPWSDIDSFLPQDADGFLPQKKRDQCTNEAFAKKKVKVGSLLVTIPDCQEVMSKGLDTQDLDLFRKETRRGFHDRKVEKAMDEQIIGQEFRADKRNKVHNQTQIASQKKKKHEFYYAR